MSEHEDLATDRADAPEADAQEQSLADGPAAPPPAPDTDRIDVPEADALEQATPVRTLGDDEPRIKDDVPEADALEQAQTAVPDDSDEY